MRRVYSAALRSGALVKDARQQRACEMLGTLQERLTAYEPELFRYRAERREIEDLEKERLKARKSAGQVAEQKEEDGEGQPKEQDLFRDLVLPRKPRGLFLHGEVGTGKTVLMDMFFETLELEKKRRVHLHDFMLEVHQRIHKWKMTEREKRLAKLEKEAEEKKAKSALARRRGVVVTQPKLAETDGITQVAKMLSEESTLFALDEFVVNDVVDALILKHLFGVMFEQGTVLVATSNTAPQNLYKNGLNYHYFKPFIPLLESHCRVFDMDSETDYRQLRKSLDASERYLTPVTSETRACFDSIFQDFCQGAKPQGKTIKVAFGRQLHVAQCVGRVCRMKFSDLCSDFEPIMSAADYQALCDEFDTIMIENVPTLGLSNHNEARRFITLIDQLYDRGVEVVILAEKPIKELYDAGAALKKEADSGLFALDEMRTAKKRTLSRLVEMTC